uniref:Putative secreted protein n=1 Tax=Ixodes ricinus TaxID=34613 RepID=A0A6B0UJM0_IXORI
MIYRVCRYLLSLRYLCITLSNITYISGRHSLGGSAVSFFGAGLPSERSSTGISKWTVSSGVASGNILWGIRPDLSCIRNGSIPCVKFRYPSISIPSSVSVSVNDALCSEFS